MKKYICILCVLFLFPALMSAEANNPFEQELPFKEATIYYKLGEDGGGKGVLYIKENGKKRSEYEKNTISYMGFKQNSESIKITMPDWIYEIDLINKIGSKSANPDKYIKEEFNKLSYSDKKKVLANAQRMGTSMSNDAKVHMKAKTILGYLCDKVEMMGMTSYSIHKTSIPLYISGSVMGVDVSKVATKISKKRVSSSHFSIPVDINIEYDPNSVAVAQEMARNIIAMLKDPESFNSNSAASNYEDVQEQQEQSQQQYNQEEEYQEQSAQEEAQAEEKQKNSSTDLSNTIGGLLKSFSGDKTEQTSEDDSTDEEKNSGEKTKDVVGDLFKSLF